MVFGMVSIRVSEAKNDLVCFLFSLRLHAMCFRMYVYTTNARSGTLLLHHIISLAWQATINWPRTPVNQCFTMTRHREQESSFIFKRDAFSVSGYIKTNPQCAVIQSGSA